MISLLAQLKTLAPRWVLALGLMAGPAALGQTVSVTPVNAWVVQGGERTFTAVRSDGQAAHWLWTLEGETFGATINQDTGLFHAPPVNARRLLMTVRATDPAAPGLTGTVVVSVARDLINALAWKNTIQDDEVLKVEAARADTAAPVWAWRVLEPHGGRIEPRGAEQYYQPPRVGGPTHVTLQVRDTAHPGDPAGQFYVRVVPAMVGLRRADPQGGRVRSGTSCDLVAERIDNLPTPFTWSVLDGGGGTVQTLGPGQARYTAPRVATLTTFHVRATSDRYDRDLAIQVWPSINLTPAVSSHVLAGNLCTLKAAYPVEAGVPQPVTWIWTMPDYRGPDLRRQGEPPEGASFSFLAPQVGRPTRFTVQVADSLHPEDPASIRVDVLPRLPGLRSGTSEEPGTDFLFQQLMPELMGPDWLHPVPAMTLLAGRLRPSHPGQRAPFHGINCIQFVEANPAMDWLSRKWLVGDHDGIKVVSARGQFGRVPRVFDDVTAIAIPPRGQPFGLAYACRHPHLPGQSMINVILPGRPEPMALAGTLGPMPEAAKVEVGRGPQVGFGEVKSLVWTEDGGLLVVDLTATGSRVRRIAPDGQVTLAGGKVIHSPYPMAWAPAAGTFYGADRHSICQWSPGDEKVVTVLGTVNMPGFEWPGGVGGMAAGIPCLNGPRGLAILGPYLFIADTGNHALRVFNLESKLLLTLAGTPRERKTRLGPLGYAAQGQSVHACAALSSPSVLGVNAEGDCVIAQGDALVHLDLSAFAVAPAEAMAAPKAMPKAGPAGQPSAGGAVPMDIDGPEPPASSAPAASAAGAAAAASAAPPASASASAAASAAPPASSRPGKKRPAEEEHEDAFRPPPPPPEPAEPN